MKKKGSITIFLVMLLTCFFPAVFAFLEAARVSGLKANARISTLQARDTVLASYNRDLWQRYHLLFWKTEISRSLDHWLVCSSRQLPGTGETGG